MEIKLLEEFIVLAKQGSYVKASKRLFLSQSALSSHIKAMEEELGFKLFQRHGAGVSLTPSGRAFLGYAYDITSMFAEGREKGLRMNGSSDGFIRMSDLHIPSGSPLRAELSARFGESIQFGENSFGCDALGQILSTGVDSCLAFSSDESMRALFRDRSVFDCEFKLVGEAGVVLVTSRASTVALKESLEVADLEKAPVVCLNLAFLDEWQLLLSRLAPGARIRLRALEGLGGIMAHSFVNEFMLVPVAEAEWLFGGRSDLVFFTELEGVPMRVPYGIIWRKGADSRFVASLLEVLGDSPLA